MNLQMKIPETAKLLQVDKLTTNCDENGKARAIIKFKKLGTITAAGICDEFGKSKFKLDAFFPGTIDLRHATFETTRASEGVLDAYLISSIGKTMVHLVFAKEYKSPEILSATLYRLSVEARK